MHLEHIDTFKFYFGLSWAPVLLVLLCSLCDNITSGASGNAGREFRQLLLLNSLSAGSASSEFPNRSGAEEVGLLSLSFLTLEGKCGLFAKHQGCVRLWAQLTLSALHVPSWGVLLLQQCPKSIHISLCKLTISFQNNFHYNFNKAAIIC